MFPLWSLQHQACFNDTLTCVCVSVPCRHSAVLFVLGSVENGRLLLTTAAIKSCRWRRHTQNLPPPAPPPSPPPPPHPTSSSTQLWSICTGCFCPPEPAQTGLLPVGPSASWFLFWTITGQPPSSGSQTRCVSMEIQALVKAGLDLFILISLGRIT